MNYIHFNFSLSFDLKYFRSLVEEEDQHLKLCLGSEMGLSSHLQSCKAGSTRIFTSNSHSSVVLQVILTALLAGFVQIQNLLGLGVVVLGCRISEIVKAVNGGMAREGTWGFSVVSSSLVYIKFLRNRIYYLEKQIKPYHCKNLDLKKIMFSWV